jgi:hypothetical protein
MAAALLARVRGLASAGRLGMECPFREREHRPCVIRSSAFPSPALGHLEPALVFIVAFEINGQCVMDKFTLSQHGMRERVCVCDTCTCKEGLRERSARDRARPVGVSVGSASECSGCVRFGGHLASHTPRGGQFVRVCWSRTKCKPHWPTHGQHTIQGSHTHTHTYPLRALHQLTAAAFTAARPLSTLMGPAQAAQNNSTHSQWRKCNPLHEMPALTDNKQLIFVTPWTHSVPTVVLVMAASAMQLANGLLHVFVSRLGSYRCV